MEKQNNPCIDANPAPAQPAAMAPAPPGRPLRAWAIAGGSILLGIGVAEFYRNYPTQPKSSEPPKTQMVAAEAIPAKEKIPEKAPAGESPPGATGGLSASAELPTSLTGSKPPVPPTAGEPPQPPPQPKAVEQPPKPDDGEMEVSKMAVTESVMFVQDLDYGGKNPPVAEAIKDVERHYEPDDGVGRTFAILEVNGETQPDGKLRLALRISTEKAGGGYLVFRRTGKVLWKAKIGPEVKKPTSAFAGKNLFIMLDINGKSLLLDGSKGPKTILDTLINGTEKHAREVWADGAEQEVTFFYSACGCPVHVKARRVGEKTTRTSELPVIFPDDPAVAITIWQLMGWGSK